MVAPLTWISGKRTVKRVSSVYKLRVEEMLTVALICGVGSTSSHEVKGWEQGCVDLF